MPFTLRNIKTDLEDVGPRFDGAPELEFRAATAELGLQGVGASATSACRPAVRFPFGHTHRRQEEVYVVVRGGGRMKLDDEVVALGEWDAVRARAGTWRGYEAGPDGLDLLVFAAPRRRPARRRRRPARLVARGLIVYSERYRIAWRSPAAPDRTIASQTSAAR